MRFNSIRWRLVLSYVILAVLTVALVGALALTLLDQFMRAQTEMQLQANARAIASQVAPLMRPVPRLGDLRDLAGSMAFLGRVRVRILDDRENLIVDSGLPGPSSAVVWVPSDSQQADQLPLLVPLSPRQARSGGGSPWMEQNFGRQPKVMMRVEEGPWGRRIVFEAVPALGTDPSTAGSTAVPQATAKVDESPAVVSARFPIGSSANPTGYVQLDQTSAPGGEILAAMRRSLLLAGLGAALAAAAAGLWVARSLTAPILALARSADQMSAGDLAVRAPVLGGGEIAHLAGQFNHMAERLQLSFAALSAERDALRRFIADASHELRTPITALSSFVELLQGPAAGDPAARAEFLAESQAQVQRMDWITRNLLDLSRLDGGLVVLDRRPYDLGDLLQAAAAPCQPRAQAKGIRLDVNLPDRPVPVVCDRSRMELAIINLVENALKFTPAGGQVTISGESVSGQARISVTDTGSGIAAEDLPHIFERFYRGRSTVEGSGLGLAIVKSVVQAHGGSVQVESTPGQGSRFTMAI